MEKVRKVTLDRFFIRISPPIITNVKIKARSSICRRAAVVAVAVAAAPETADLGKWVTLWEDTDDKFENIEGTWRNKTNIESAKD